jgi:hypothetical protein
MSVSGVYASNFWYKYDQAWNHSRAAISQQFLDASALVNTAMTNALSNQISGTATLAAQAALKRIKGKTAAATAGTSTTATSNTSTTAKSSSAGKSSSTSKSGSAYTSTSAASILGSSNVVNFFA